MKKVILAFMLLAAIKSNAQLFKDSKTVNQLDSNELKKIMITEGYYYRPTIHINGFRETKIHIDSVYLQRIIEALEERGYTLVKLPKKN